MDHGIRIEELQAWCTPWLQAYKQEMQRLLSLAVVLSMQSDLKRKSTSQFGCVISMEEGRRKLNTPEKLLIGPWQTT